MSFGISPNCGARAAKVSSGNGLSILATLISPLIAVCLSEYLHTQEKHQTTFALPVPGIDASLPEDSHPEPRPKPTVADDSPRDIQPWQTFISEPEKQALAKKLIGRANGAKDDPASRFVTLRLAKDIATQANDGQTAFLAIDAMAETFHVDANAMKMAVLAKFAAAAQKPAQHKSIAEQALKLVDQAVSQDHFMIASQLGKLALAEAKRAPDKELVAHAEGQITEVAELVKARERPSRLSGSWQQQAHARLEEELQPKTQENDGTDYGNDLLTAKSKHLRALKPGPG